MKQIEDNHLSSKQSRRKFLKKALYSSPTLIALGTLTKPTHLQADSIIVGPPGGRGGIPASTGGLGNGLGGGNGLGP